MDHKTLNRDIQPYISDLIKDVKLKPDEAKTVASYISAEVRFLTDEQKDELVTATPVSLRERLLQLQLFQDWTGVLVNDPATKNAAVVMTCYICFIYLPESCFRVLKKHSKQDSVTRKCCKFLSDNPVRAFRNAFAHSNWTYRENPLDGSLDRIVYWARKGEDKTEPLVQFEVSLKELNFWQMLAKVVAYSSFSNLVRKETETGRVV